MFTGKYPCRPAAASTAGMLTGLILLGASLTACRHPLPVETAEKTGKTKESDGEWQVLFDGKTLKGWKETEFGGKDEVAVKDGRIVLDFGAAELSGVTYTGKVPTMNYEVTLEAMRVDGTDFFCGLTFPVKDSFCSLILGGWGGSLVGISSFDGMDASENETTTIVDFENRRWYRVLLRVTENRIEVWIDGKLTVDTRPGKRRISVRYEVEPSKPFGIAAWNTRAALRDIRVRGIHPAASDGR